jgi:hypothetical protein
MFWLVTTATIVGIVLLAALVWIARSATRWRISHAALTRDGRGRNLRLIRAMARDSVYPVRLTGVGGAAQRFDMSLIDEQPDLDLGGVPARTLSELKNRNSFAVIHPAHLQLWIRSGFRSFRCVVELPWDKVKKTTFIPHDPDGIGVIDNVYRGSVGTLRVSTAERLHIYLLIRIKPEPALMGPWVTHEG